MLQRTLKRSEVLLGRLPPTLYLQLDNCFRENKNSSLANWCALLTERGLFPGGIHISFLPKGHTHNECDQVASRLSIAVRRKSILTRSDLYDVMKKCFKRVELESLDYVADNKKFINPTESVNWTGSPFHMIHHISKHRFFRIKKTKAGLEMRTRQDCKQEVWSLSHLMRRQHLTRSGLSYHDLSKHPGYTYKVLEPALLKKIRESLDKCRPRLSDRQWYTLMTECTQLFSPKPPAQLDPKVRALIVLHNASLTTSVCCV